MKYEDTIATWERQFGAAAATRYTFGYDKANQLTAATLAETANPQNVLKRFSYQYDPAGNRVSKQHDAVVTSASFNNANQLTGTTGGGKLLVAGHTDEPAKVTVNSQPAQTDAQNNYQAWINVTPGPNTITVEAEDWSPNANTATKSWSVNVTSGTARTFTYDGNGNTLSDGFRTYQWDAQDRLVKITQGTDEYEFIYDGLDRRVAEKLNGTITRRWVWDGTEIAEQRAPDGTTIDRRYYQQGEQRLGGSDAGTYFYSRDHLGSIRELTDNTAALRARYDYDPHGQREKLSGNLDIPWGYTGHYHHESGLILTLYRAYDAELGRWLSRDPIGEEGGINLYGYVLNNPINMWDPFGLWSLYRFIYTGDGNASDDVYNAAVDAAGEYIYCKSGVRGVTVGGRFNFPSKNTVRGQVSAGVSATMDNGLGAQAGAGINVKTGKGTNMTFGGGYAWNQREGGGWRGGGSLSSEGVRGSQGFSDGQFGGTVLGLNFGPFANAGLVIDPQRVMQNFKDSFDILRGKSIDSGCP